MMFGLLVAAWCASSSFGMLYPAKNDAAVASFHALEVFDARSYIYMPKEKVLVCACAKCGSTSLFEFLYYHSFLHTWNYTGTPFIQDVVSSRWENKFKLLEPAQAKGVIANEATFSFAMSRDPKSRIISAWKSKAACDDGFNWGTDVDDRARIVPALLAMAGLPDAGCLSFEGFVEAIATAHRKGKAAELNPHFRPQQHGCFREFKPSQWSKVAPISDASAAHLLGMRFGHPNVEAFPHAHRSSASGAVNITEKAQQLLDEITKEEYATLATARGLL